MSELGTRKMPPRASGASSRASSTSPMSISMRERREAMRGRPARRMHEPQLAELRALCMAIDLGSLGRAARVMHVSQPALSKRLRSLERWAGVRLLVRSNQGVSPTPAGTRLYPLVRRLLADDEALSELIDRLHG